MQAAKRQLHQRCEKLEARDQEMQPELQKAQQLQLMLQEEQQLRQNLEEELSALRASRGAELPEAVLSAADLAHHMKQRPEGAAPSDASRRAGALNVAMAPEPINGQLVRIQSQSVLELGAGNASALKARVGRAAKAAGASRVTLTDRGAVVSRLRCEVADDRYDVILALGMQISHGPATSSTTPNPDIDRLSIPFAALTVVMVMVRPDGDVIGTDAAVTVKAGRAGITAGRPLSWKDFGNPRSQIPVGGVLTKISEITEDLQERLTDEEHVTFEGIFTQLFLLQRRTTGKATKRKRTDEELHSRAKRAKAVRLAHDVAAAKLKARRAAEPPAEASLVAYAPALTLKGLTQFADLFEEVDLLALRELLKAMLAQEDPDWQLGTIWEFKAKVSTEQSSDLEHLGEKAEEEGEEGERWFGFPGGDGTVAAESSTGDAVVKVTDKVRATAENVEIEYRWCPLPLEATSLQPRPKSSGTGETLEARGYG
ncbi:hypothetical protein AK812_SmicGene15265 [Symbiodinium microadriaticum]|uniref:Uncharacterized protein n=1 Tax=Symbiodinium microadriaticum TaxID=2951 RepID=A0A1Q9E3F6_SYMMI|nr:hypothetical protein AK812_SmicGene15265 [Symbiodinium microadriaticum]